MTDIFISYAREDKDRAAVLAKELRKNSWSVWWDRKIPPGKTFSKVIEEAIGAAKCVIVLWSKDSTDSDWVQNEAAEGARNKNLVPALIDDVQIPFEFRRIQAADLTDWQAQPNHPGFTNLINAITHHVGQPAEKKDVEKSKAKPKEKPLAKASVDHPPEQMEEREPSPPGPKPGKRKMIIASVLLVIIMAIAVTLMIDTSGKKKKTIDYPKKFESLILKMEALVEQGKVTNDLDELISINDAIYQDFLPYFDKLSVGAKKQNINPGPWRRQFAELEDHWSDVLQAKKRELENRTR